MSIIESTGVSYAINPDGVLYISEEITAQLNKFRQISPGAGEAGGILLGHQYENKADIVVDEITTPLTTDKRTRHSYFRSRGHHDIAVDRWKDSHGECLYLGLWHTHPEEIPTPSNKDIIDWSKAINQGEFEGEKLFFIIVGINETLCWQGNRISKLKRVFRAKNDFRQLSVTNE